MRASATTPLRALLRGRLYHQIALPVVAAALVIGALSTLVALHFFTQITEEWASDRLKSASTILQARLSDRMRGLEDVAAMVAADTEVIEAVRTTDPDAATRVLAAVQRSKDLEGVAILDGSGRAFAALSRSGSGSASGVCETQEVSEIGVGTCVEVLRAPGEDHLALVARARLGSEQPYVVCVSLRVDDELLADLAEGSGAAYALHFDALGWVAVSGVSGRGEQLGPAALTTALADNRAAVSDVLATVSASDERTASTLISVGGGPYAVRADRIALSSDPDHPLGDGVLFSLVGAQANTSAQRTATTLIALGSVVSVLAIGALGVRGARRVSDPLVALKEGARHVSEGDYSVKIEVRGENEIAELARSFNHMTESLRDRSDALNRKVFELTALYEMSGSFGATLQMDELLRSVLDSAVRIFAADVGYVTLRDRATGELCVQALHGHDPRTLQRTDSGNPMSEWVVGKSRPLLLNSPGGMCTEHVETVTCARAALCVPLVSGDETIGAITVGHHDPERRFDAEDVRLLSTIANHVMMAVGNIELFKSLEDAYVATVRSLAVAVDAKDPYTRGHSEGVAVYADLIAERIGLPAEERRALEMAAYLHDIGKIGIKEEILRKPGALSDSEMGQMRHHPIIGASILKPVAFPWPILPIVLHHHERWDGRGYPAGLQGEEIPLLARMLTVADAYEAMISDRPYRSGRDGGEAIDELRRCAGTQFDPALVAALIDALADVESLRLEERHGEGDPACQDETAMVLCALGEAMIASFGSLAGKQMVANFERRANELFRASGLRVSVTEGKVRVEEIPESDADHLVRMRRALGVLETVLRELSGHALVDHYYLDARATLSNRLNRLAERLGFYPL